MKTTGLSIQEAIKSGLPFKRPNFPLFMNVRGCTIVRSDGQGYTLDTHDIQATDWEVKQTPIEVWLNVYPDGGLGGPYTTVERARAYKDDNGVTRKFVEVIE